MMLWLFVVVVAASAFAWLRMMRRARETWLRALDLVGKWELDAAGNGSEAVLRTLTLSGSLTSGSYVARDGDAIHRGMWRLRGHILTLEPKEGRYDAAGPVQYDLRLFEVGRIGLDGPGREREIYVKREGNVIRMPARR